MSEPKKSGKALKEERARLQVDAWIAEARAAAVALDVGDRATDEEHRKWVGWRAPIRKAVKRLFMLLPPAARLMFIQNLTATVASLWPDDDLMSRGVDVSGLVHAVDQVPNDLLVVVLKLRGIDVPSPYWAKMYTSGERRALIATLFAQMARQTDVSTDPSLTGKALLAAAKRNPELLVFLLQRCPEAES